MSVPVCSIIYSAKPVPFIRVRMRPVQNLGQFGRFRKHFERGGGGGGGVGGSISLISGLPALEGRKKGDDAKGDEKKMFKTVSPMGVTEGLLHHKRRKDRSSMRMHW